MSIDPLICPSCKKEAKTERLSNYLNSGSHIEENWFCNECNITYSVIYEAKKKQRK